MMLTVIQVLAEFALGNDKAKMAVGGAVKFGFMSSVNLPAAEQSVRSFYHHSVVTSRNGANPRPLILPGT
jgi:hypothetical protein